MRLKLKKEIKELIRRETHGLREFEVYRSGGVCGYYEQYEYAEIIKLILEHLGLEPHTECKYPRNVLKTKKSGGK